MIDDPVYQGFVSPVLRAERLRAEEERQRAEEERQRAEAERQRAETERQIAAKERTRAERYAAMLKSMGVALDDDPAAQ